MTALTVPTSQSSYGRVVGRIIRRVGDGDDAGTEPDALPMGGTITFSPLTKWTRTTNYSALASHEDIAGVLNPLTGELMSPGQPPLVGVDLIVGVYRVSFALEHGSLESFNIEVKSTHTAADPLDLAHEAPYTPAPGVTHTMLVPSGIADGSLLGLSGGQLVGVDPATLGGGGGGLTTKGVQDVVGAMVAGAGGTYDDGAGTITLPAGGGGGGGRPAFLDLGSRSGAVTVDAADAETVAIATAAGVTLAVTGAGTVGVLITNGGGHTVALDGVVDVDGVFPWVDTWGGQLRLGIMAGRAYVIEQIPGVTAPEDTAAPVGSVSASTIGSTLTATATFTDDVGVTHYRFALTSAGLSAAAWQSSPSWSTGITSSGTVYAQARDAAGNVSSVASAAYSYTAPPPGVDDDFARPNAAGLGATSTGRVWVIEAGGWAINAEEASFTGGVDSAAVIDSGIADNYAVEVRVVSQSGSYPVTIFGRWVNSSQSIKYYRDAASRWVFSVNGATTRAFNDAVLTNGDILRLEVAGTSYTLKRNGVTVATASSSAHATSTMQGVGGASGCPLRIDDFKVVAL